MKDLPAAIMEPHIVDLASAYKQVAEIQRMATDANVRTLADSTLIKLERVGEFLVRVVNPEDRDGWRKRISN